MKLIYDPNDDILRIRFNNFPIERTLQDGDGTTFDFDVNNRLVAIEMARASQMVGNPCVVEVGDHTRTFSLTDPAS